MIVKSSNLPKFCEKLAIFTRRELYFIAKNIFPFFSLYFHFFLFFSFFSIKTPADLISDSQSSAAPLCFLRNMSNILKSHFLRAVPFPLSLWKRFLVYHSWQDFVSNVRGCRSIFCHFACIWRDNLKSRVLLFLTH